MPGKGEDRPQGLAEQSVNTSVVHPGPDAPGRREQDDGADGTRRLPENEQREGQERTDPTRSEPEGRSDP